jgi:hypothetical protein
MKLKQRLRILNHDSAELLIGQARQKKKIAILCICWKFQPSRLWHPQHNLKNYNHFRLKDETIMSQKSFLKITLSALFWHQETGLMFPRVLWGPQTM